jgi:uncharacterized protein YbjQ (UPF0145 family)
MIVSTKFEIEGYQVSNYLGLVRGVIVRSPTIAQGIAGGLKSLIGGNIGPFTEMCDQARQHAYDRMIEHAQQMGANGVIGVSYDASDLGGREPGTEVLCYGTAVILQKRETE